MEWIKCSERLPQQNEYILIYSTKIDINFAKFIYVRKDFYYFDQKGDWDFTMDEVTHWMPLPEPPKE